MLDVRGGQSSGQVSYGFFAPFGVGWVRLIRFMDGYLSYSSFVQAFVPLRTPGLNWRSYRRDSFYGLVWRWDYHGDRIDDPVPYCRQCDTQVIAREEYEYGSFGRRLVTYCICDHCSGTAEKFDESFRDMQNKVIRQVDRKLRNQEWRTSVASHSANA
jgi:hypothetical protein